jgi:tetratricopeptide (TPR) repeat protein
VNDPDYQFQAGAQRKKSMNELTYDLFRVPGTGPVKEFENASWDRNRLPVNPDLAKIDEALKASPEDPKLWLEKGMILKNMNYYRESCDCYSRGITIDPFNWEFYRHRAHRFISTIRFADAAADFRMASRLNPGDFHIWYHLGLAYFLLRMFDDALAAYETCYAVTTEKDPLPDIVDWYWRTLMRLGRKDEAQAVADKFIADDEKYNPIDTAGYYHCCLLYKGLMDPETFLQVKVPAGRKWVAGSTKAFCLANYYLMYGQKDKAVAIMKDLIKNNEGMDAYSSFGYLAAKIEMAAIEKGL